MAGSSPDLNICLMVLTACNKAGKWEKVLAVLRKHGAGLGLPVYNFMLELCSKSGQWPQVLDLYKEMGEGNLALESAAYHHVLAACEKSGQPDKALAVAAQMKTANNGGSVDRAAFESLIRVCARSARLKETEELLQEVREGRALNNQI